MTRVQRLTGGNKKERKRGLVLVGHRGQMELVIVEDGTCLLRAQRISEAVLVLAINLMERDHMTSGELQAHTDTAFYATTAVNKVRS